MESLLDRADRLAAMEQPDLPDFDIPAEYRPLQEPSHLLELKDTSTKGRGWFARVDLPVGTVVMVAKPIAMLLDMDCVDEDGPDVDAGANRNQDVNMYNPTAATAADGDLVMADDVEDQYEDDNDDAVNNNDEDDDELEEDAIPADDESEPRHNEILLVDILEGLQENPSIWFNQLNTLFPRTEDEVNSLPAWVCPKDGTFLKVESAVEALKSIPPFTDKVVKEVAKRLPHIIRYNVLSVETCSELLSYPGPGGHSNLSGVALYHYPSFFNHSSRPNCNRWAVGDVMFFVSNQPIAAGVEVCISYIEHDVLCESAFRRNRILRMDFHDSDPGTTIDLALQQLEEQGPEMPVVDADVQNELMTMDPFQRLESIEQLLHQAKGEIITTTGSLNPNHSAMENESVSYIASGWFKCDIHNLCILKAITLEGLGQREKALHLWELAIAFCDEKLPPLDESSVVVRTQAALCSFQVGDIPRAHNHAQVAVQTHNLVFGGGTAYFRRRYRHDLALTFQSRKTRVNGASPVDVLWPLPTTQ